MKIFVASGAILAGIGVIAGAFGAHALEGVLSEQQIETFQVGVRYQMVHALAILAVGLLKTHHAGTLLDLSGWCFIVGILFFSGSIYLLTLTGMKWLGPITPIGGLFLIGGWTLLAFHAITGS